MTKKWTNNILTRTFDISAGKASDDDNRIQILAAAKPIAAFFEKLGFKGADKPPTVAQRWMSSSQRLNLVAIPENSTGTATDPFNALTIGLNLQSSGNITHEHPLVIRVSLNEKNGGKYQLMNATGTELLVSGAPNKVVDEFIRRTEGDMREMLMTSANIHYTRNELKRFAPVATQPALE